MEIIDKLFGHGEDLNILQMCMRAAVMFIVALILIRFSGRRSFGMRMPFDNVIAILLGAILSRAVTGASPFLHVIAASTVIVVLHRFCAWIALYSDGFGRLIKGEPKILYERGKLNKEDMNHCLISHKDLQEGIRINANIDDVSDAESIYAERNGQISVVKKKDETGSGK